MSNVPDWYRRDVSRETIEALAEYAALIEKWTRKINLISTNSVDAINERHIWDSAQVYTGQSGVWVDLGSGGGLPGIVVALLRKGEGGADQTTLIESDQRKATFLRTCARTLSLNVSVVAERIEESSPIHGDIVSARALTNLEDLLPLALRHMKPDAECVLLKGATWKQEIADAERSWRFSCVATPSKTNPEAAVLTIKDIARV